MNPIVKKRPVWIALLGTVRVHLEFVFTIKWIHDHLRTGDIEGAVWCTWDDELNKFPGLKESLTTSGIRIKEIHFQNFKDHTGYILQALQLEKCMDEIPSDAIIIKCRTDYSFNWLSTNDELFLSNKYLNSMIKWGHTRFPLFVMRLSLIPLFRFGDLHYIGSKSDLIKLNDPCGNARNRFWISPDDRLLLIHTSEFPILDTFFKSVDISKMINYNDTTEDFYLPGVLNKVFALYCVILDKCYYHHSQKTNNTIRTMKEIFVNSSRNEFMIAPLDWPTLDNIISGKLEHTTGYDLFLKEVRLMENYDYAVNCYFTSDDWKQTIAWGLKYLGINKKDWLRNIPSLESVPISDEEPNVPSSLLEIDSKKIDNLYHKIIINNYKLKTSELDAESIKEYLLYRIRYNDNDALIQLISNYVTNGLLTNEFYHSTKDILGWSLYLRSDYYRWLIFATEASKIGIGEELNSFISTICRTTHIQSVNDIQSLLLILKNWLIDNRFLLSNSTSRKYNLPSGLLLMILSIGRITKDIDINNTATEIENAFIKTIDCHSVDALFNISNELKSGNRCAKDVMKASSWCLKGYEKSGRGLSQFLDLCSSSENHELYKIMLEVANKDLVSDNHYSYKVLSDAYKYGRGTKINYQKSLEYIKKYSDFNYNALIDTYQLIVDADLTDNNLITELLERMKSLNKLPFTEYVGRIYRKGIGVEKNLAISAEYFRKAFEEGDKWSRFQLFDVLWEMNNEKYYPEMVKLMSDQSIKDDSDTYLRLGRMYLYGRGLSKDVQQSYNYLKLATLKNNKHSAILLDVAPTLGPKTMESTRCWLDQIIDDKDCTASLTFYKMGLIYTTNQHITANPELALYYFKKCIDCNQDYLNKTLLKLSQIDNDCSNAIKIQIEEKYSDLIRSGR